MAKWEIIFTMKITTKLWIYLHLIAFKLQNKASYTTTLMFVLLSRQLSHSLSISLFPSPLCISLSILLFLLLSRWRLLFWWWWFSNALIMIMSTLIMMMTMIWLINLNAWPRQIREEELCVCVCTERRREEQHLSQA